MKSATPYREADYYHKRRKVKIPSRLNILAQHKYQQQGRVYALVGTFASPHQNERQKIPEAKAKMNTETKFK